VLASRIHLTICRYKGNAKRFEVAHFAVQSGDKFTVGNLTIGKSLGNRAALVRWHEAEGAQADPNNVFGGDTLEQLLYHRTGNPFRSHR
jgi:hypothetical protein